MFSHHPSRCGFGGGFLWLVIGRSPAGACRLVFNFSCRRNYSILIENFTFDAYEEFLDGLSNFLSDLDIEYRLKQFCDVFTEIGLRFYIRNRSILYNKYDLNFDGMVGFSDFALSFIHIVKHEDYKWYYDVNNDDNVDFLDLKLIWNSK